MHDDDGGMHRSWVRCALPVCIHVSDKTMIPDGVRRAGRAGRAVFVVCGLSLISGAACWSHGHPLMELRQVGGRRVLRAPWRASGVTPRRGNVAQRAVPGGTLLVAPVGASSMVGTPPNVVVVLSGASDDGARRRSNRPAARWTVNMLLVCKGSGREVVS